MRGMTNVFQITPERQSKFRISVLMVGEEKKNSQGNSQKKKGIYFLLSGWNRLLPLETMELKRRIRFFFLTSKNIQLSELNYKYFITCITL